MAVVVAVAVIFGLVADRPRLGGILNAASGRRRPATRVVAVNVNSARRATLRNAALVTNLVNGLPASTQFVVLTVIHRPSRSPMTGPIASHFSNCPSRARSRSGRRTPSLVLTGAGDTSTC